MKSENEQSPSPLVILVMGGPASGKGTYCKKLCEEFGLIHLSIGDILREERKKTTADCLELNERMIEFEQTGKLMHCDIVAYFLIKSMKEQGWNNSVFLIDGFVKAEAGYYHWMDKMSNQVDLKFVLYLECSAACMQKRMHKRAESSGRLDDNENIFDTRVKTFFKRTLPAIQLFANTGLVNKVNTEDDMQKVYEAIRQCFFKYFPDFKF